MVKILYVSCFLQQVSRLEMQRFQELSLRSLANMHHHDKRVWRRIKRLEQNIRLVAHAVVLSQIEESKSRVLIKKINQELQALKGAVKNSYIWHVCKMKKKMFSGFNLKITTHQCKVFFSVDSKMFSSIWLESVKCILRLFWKNRKNIIYYAFRL